tara:strand:- start:230 stop:424 length:195 start_codon:yes stop_codon:yes gene_type:complete
MERLFKDGLITTIIGILILGGAVYMYLSKDFTSMEAGELAILGMVFLRAKNSLIMLAPKKKDSV